MCDNFAFEPSLCQVRIGLLVSSVCCVVLIYFVQRCVCSTKWLNFDYVSDSSAAMRL